MESELFHFNMLSKKMNCFGFQHWCLFAIIWQNTMYHKKHIILNLDYLATFNAHFSSVKYIHIAFQQVSRTFVLQYQKTSTPLNTVAFPHIDKFTFILCFMILTTLDTILWIIITTLGTFALTYSIYIISEVHHVITSDRFPFFPKTFIMFHYMDIYHIFFIHSFSSGHLGCFCILLLWIMLQWTGKCTYPLRFWF